MITSSGIKHRQLVLVVDDYEINRDVLGAILRNDYDVIFASNGKEAIEMMRESAGSLSIVLLDLIMPVMNGFAVIEYVKNDEQLRSIPIIALTAEKNTELHALKLGAADFIAKPFDAHEVVLARVGRIIELNEGRQLISAAEHDHLTMLYNPSFFFEYANRLVQYHPELHWDAIVMDIEQFHTINEVNGRDFGDEVLRVLSAEIHAFLSETQGIAGRFGADGFDILCVARDGDYHTLLDRFQHKMNELSANVSIHLRMGVNHWEEGASPVVMFDRARAACNMVRGNYRAPLMVYNEAMHGREVLNQRLLGDLRAAIAERQLCVYYQPKYDIQSNPPKLSSAEALVRWNHPDLGMIQPNDFVPLFEENGLISVVDDYVWREAARQVRVWRDMFGFAFPVSVNLSRSDVFDPALVDRLASLIEEHDLAFSDIELELTESAYTDNASQVLVVIRRLRDLGFQIGMDDFGSGYSSLNMLSDMPVDVLKMDRKFVRNIEESETDRRLVNLILDIARCLNVPVVAEGVETQEQIELLREGGCNYVQGFFFSRPLPPEQFEELMRTELVSAGE